MNWKTRAGIDQLYLAEARRQHRRAHAIRNSFLSGTVSEVIFQTVADYSAIASFTTETSLLSGARQPSFPAGFFDNQNKPGKGIRIVAKGVLGTTSTPTYTFQVRLGTTSGITFITGTSVGVSAAITTQSGVTNVYWELAMDIICTVPGIGTGNCTLSGAGLVSSPAGFASPFVYPLEPTTPNTATWTSTIDDSLTQYLNLSVTSSANSASNTLTMKQLIVYGLN
jgi:hypothetical protein